MSSYENYLDERYGSFPVPSGRLGEPKGIQRKRPRITPMPTPSLRALVFIEKGFICWWCGVGITLDPTQIRRGIPLATVDHVIPRSKGGTNQMSNLVPCCAECNSLKGNLHPYVWLAKIFDCLDWPRHKMAA